MHRRHLSEHELSEVVARVAAMEAAGEIQPWSQQDAPSCLMPELPPRGTIVSRRALPELGATEMQLSNGMRVRLITIIAVSTAGFMVCLVCQSSAPSLPQQWVCW